jgi:hypothetical protein
MTLTNNSYGSSLTDCNYFGDYDGNATALDAMMNDHPEFTAHLFLLPIQVA